MSRQQRMKVQEALNLLVAATAHGDSKTASNEHIKKAQLVLLDVLKELEKFYEIAESANDVFGELERLVGKLKCVTGIVATPKAKPSPVQVTKLLMERARSFQASTEELFHLWTGMKPPQEPPRPKTP